MRTSISIVLLAGSALVSLSSAACSSSVSLPNATDAGIAAEDSAAPPSIPDASPQPDPTPARPDAGPERLKSLDTSRSLFPAVATPEGIRVVGGLSGALLDATERYDAAKNRWVPFKEDAIARYAHAAAADAEGRVYVLGGTTDGQSPIAAASVYDPKTDTFLSLPDMPEPRLGLGVAAFGDKVLAFGGKGPRGTTDGVLAFDTKTRTWSSSAPMPTSRMAFATVVVGTKVYFVGGRDPNDVPVGTVESYDTITGTFATHADLPSPRFWLCAAASADGRIFAAGGVDRDGFLDTVEAFTPESGWKKVAVLPTPRAWHACARGTDDRIYVLGGAVRKGSAPAHQSDLVAYDPTRNTWGIDRTR